MIMTWARIISHITRRKNIHIWFQIYMVPNTGLGNEPERVKDEWEEKNPFTDLNKISTHGLNVFFNDFYIRGI